MTFKKEATGIRRAMCWRNWRLKILITFLCLVAVYIIIGIACGFDFACFRKKETPPVNPPP